LRQPDVKERIAFAGADTVGNTAEEFAAFIRAERAKYARIVKDANIKME
jgi:tripartite-type tricarboxylate transporter receptor subunit TctC